VKTSDGYRFCLKFRVLSDAHWQVGDYLESLGNKKSEVVVTAMIEYLKAHPEALNKDNPVRVIAAYGLSEETLTAKIEAMVWQLTDGLNVNVPGNSQPDGRLDAHDSNALDVLLDGLDQFV